MDIFQTYYIEDKGWRDPFPDLDSPQTLVLIFAHPDYLALSTPFKEISKYYPNSVIAGCSTPAGILDNKVVEKQLVVSITRFCDTRMSLVAVEKNEIETSVELGNRVVRALEEDSLVGVLTFADGEVVNGSQYMQGISQIMTNHIIVTGGLAANSGTNSKSWVIKSDRPWENVACGIGFYGDSVNFLSSKGGGWRSFGIKRTITKSDQEIVYELDEKPALTLYKNYLGEAANRLLQSGLLYPLSILSENHEDTIVRSIMSVDEEKQSISFAGDMPLGVSAQLMYGTIENLIEGAEEAVDNLKNIHTYA